MSFLGDFLKIVAIGAFFVATGPFGLTISSGLATALRIGGVVLGYLGSLIDRPQLLAERQQFQTKTDPGAMIPVVYGRAKVGAVVADWFLDGTTHKRLYYIAVLCHGSADGLGVAAVDEIWFDQRRGINPVTGERWFPYRLVTCNYKIFLGTDTQFVGGTAFYTDGTGAGITFPGAVGGSGWDALLDRGRGLCIAGFVFENVQIPPVARPISNVATGNPAEITYDIAFLGALGNTFLTNDLVAITGTSTTPNINAQWRVTRTAIDKFTIPINVTGGAGAGGIATLGDVGPVFNGPPTVAAIIRGNRIYDHSLDTWVPAGTNPAWCIRDYLLAPIYGCGFAAALINEASFLAAATYCDALVRYQVGTAVTITSSSVANPTVITTATNHGWATGQLVRIAGHTGSTPALDGDYTVTSTGLTTFTIPVNVTIGGTGGTVIKLVEQKRFECNGAVDTSRPTSDNLQELLSSCRGNLVWQQGQFALSIRSSDVLAGTCATPLISNGDFTLGTAYWKAWNAAAFSVPTDGTKAHSGTRYGQLTSTTGVDANLYAADVTGATILDLAVVAGETRQFGAWLYRESGTANVRCYLDLLDSAKAHVSYAATPTQNTAAWALVQSQVTIPAGVVYVRFLVDADAAGTGVVLRIDDCFVSAPLALTPSNIIGEWNFRNAGLEEKWNLVKATYIEPANGEFKTQDVQWPPVGVTNSYLTADGGFSNRLDLALPFTTDQLTAQAIAQVTLNESRVGLTCQVHCTEEAVALTVGDLVAVTHPTPGWTAKSFWVTAMQLMPDTTVMLSLQEYDPLAYSLDTIDDRRSVSTTDHESIFVVPAPGSVTATPLTPDGLLITWIGAAYGLVDYYEVQAKCSSAGDSYITIARIREGDLLQASEPRATAGQTWLARVRVVNVVGWPGPWTESSPTAIPDTGTICGVGTATYVGYAPTITITPPPPDLTAVGRTQTGGNLCGGGAQFWKQTVSWTVTSPDDTNFRIDLDMATDSGGASFASLITGLTTVSSSYEHNTGVCVPMGGTTNSTLYYRKYRVKLVRISDATEIEHIDTSQGTLQSTTSCPFP